MSFQTITEFDIKENYIESFLQGSEEDVDYNHNLKEISQIYLKENGFELGDEPEAENMSSKEFTKYIENKSTEENLMIEKFEELNVEINFRSLLSNVYDGKNGKRIFVFFLPTDDSKKNVGKNIIKIFCYLMLSLDCKEGLVVTKKPLTSVCKDRLDCSNISPKSDPNIYNITCYVDSEFLPICKHSLVPKVLKIYRYPEDVKKFQEENHNIDVENFPRMVLNDPLVKFYRGSHKDIFKLERKIINEKNILNTQIVYRIVSKSVLNKNKK